MDHVALEVDDLEARLILGPRAAPGWAPAGASAARAKKPGVEGAALRRPSSPGGHVVEAVRREAAASPMRERWPEPR